MTTILHEAVAGRATIMPWTVEQYHRAIETRLLSEDTSVELIDGFIVHKDRAAAGEARMTIGHRHQIAVMRLAQAAPDFERHGCFLQTQQPISLPPFNEPEPDGAVVRGAIDDSMTGPPRAPDVSCVIEVSDSSLTVDLGPKQTVYAAAGIRQYVVADLVNNSVLIHEEPAGTTYKRVTRYARGETLPMAAGSGQVSLAAERLLP